MNPFSYSIYSDKCNLPILSLDNVIHEKEMIFLTKNINNKSYQKINVILSETAGYGKSFFVDQLFLNYREDFLCVCIKNYVNLLEDEILNAIVNKNVFFNLKDFIVLLYLNIVDDFICNKYLNLSEKTHAYVKLCKSDFQKYKSESYRLIIEEIFQKPSMSEKYLSKFFRMKNILCHISIKDVSDFFYDVLMKDSCFFSKNSFYILDILIKLSKYSRSIFIVFDETEYIKSSAQKAWEFGFLLRKIAELNACFCMVTANRGPWDHILSHWDQAFKDACAHPLILSDLSREQSQKVLNFYIENVQHKIKKGFQENIPLFLDSFYKNYSHKSIREVLKYMEELWDHFKEEEGHQSFLETSKIEKDNLFEISNISEKINNIDEIEFYNYSEDFSFESLEYLLNQNFFHKSIQIMKNDTNYSYQYKMIYKDEKEIFILLEEKDNWSTWKSILNDSIEICLEDKKMICFRSEGMKPIPGKWKNKELFEKWSHQLRIVVLPYGLMKNIQKWYFKLRKNHEFKNDEEKQLFFREVLYHLFLILDLDIEESLNLGKSLRKDEKSKLRKSKNDIYSYICQQKFVSLELVLEYVEGDFSYEEVVQVLENYQDIEMIRRNGETFFYKKD